MEPPHHHPAGQTAGQVSNRDRNVPSPWPGWTTTLLLPGGIVGVTALAEFALDVACSEAFAELDARHGAPMSSLGKRAQLWVVGMGKLGGRELNYSSDIDLIFAYDPGAEGDRDELHLHEPRDTNFLERTLGNVIHGPSASFKEAAIPCSKQP